MFNKRKHNYSQFLKRITAPLIVIALSAIVSLGVSERFERELQTTFKHESEHVLQITLLKLDNYRDLLYSGRAFVNSSQSVTKQEWRTFFNQQAAFDRYAGISSIAYVTNVDSSQLAAFETKMRTNEYFGPTFNLKSVSERDDHAFVNMYVSQNDLKTIEGLDLLRSDDRYEIYRSASAKGSVVASPSMKLATGYEGFYTLLAVYKNDLVEGYILTSFRNDELMKQLFSNESLGYRVTDITDDKAQRLYQSSSWSENGYKYSRTIYVGTRRWNVEVSDQIDQRPVGFLLPAAIMTTGSILAATLFGMSMRPNRRRSKEI